MVSAQSTFSAVILLSLYLTVLSPDVWAQQSMGQILAVGKQVFTTHCINCHKTGLNVKAPDQAILSQMPPRAIWAALETGKMRAQAEGLTTEQKQAVAQFLTSKRLKDISMPDEAFTKFTLPDQKKVTVEQTGWGGNLEGTGFRTAQQAGITSKTVGSLKLKWAFALPDVSQVRCKPAVIGDWLVVGSQNGDVYCLQKQTGKIGWHFAASAPIRGAISVVQQGNDLHAYFVDNATNVYALDVKTGKALWQKRVGQHAQSANTGSVVVYKGIVYVPLSSLEVSSAVDPNYPCCSSSGEVVAVNARSGEEVWRHRVVQEEAKEVGIKKNGKPYYGPSGGIVWCSPTVDAKRGLLYIGTGENYTTPATKTSDAIQALDLKTGKLVWNFQATEGDTWNMSCPGSPNCPEKTGPDLDFGMAPILVKRPDGKEILVVGQKAAIVYGLSPDTGKLLWKTPVGKGGALGGIHWGMATDGQYVYAANADNKYAVDQRDTLRKPAPGLYALDVATGQVIWKAATPPCGSRMACIEANSAAPTVVPGVVFAGALDGFIRAYSTADGHILWEFDTVREYQPVNGIQGKGGSIDGPSPTVSDGMLFVGSGYGMFGELPGNVLLAFAVEP